MKFLNKITKFMNSNKKDSEENKETNALIEVLEKKKKIKIVFIIIAIFFALFSVFFIIMMVIIIMEHFGMIDFIRDREETSYSNNIYYWWPIGSAETETKNGITYASGDPQVTYITSYFGYRDAPTAYASSYHQAIDIGNGGYGSGVINIIAMADGVVTGVVSGCVEGNESCGGYAGNHIIISHDNNVTSVYNHLYSTYVSEGDTVYQGQVIGKMGNTGTSTGAHLDFRISVNGVYVDPLNYVDPNEPRKVGKITEGKDNKQTVCLTLKAYGYDNSAVAALMNNISHESNYDPNAENYLGCRGIVQWCFSRKNSLVNKYGSDWNDIANQFEFFFEEMESSYSTVNSVMFNSAYSTYDKVSYFCNHFEIPGSSICAGRANEWANYTSYVENGCSD